MKEDKNSESTYEGGGLKGPLYWLAGVATAVAAKAVSGPGGPLGGLLGGNVPPPDGPGAPVSQRVLDLTTENTRLRSESYADRLNAAQMVWNAKQEVQIACQQKQIDQLYTLTRLVVPNDNLNPGVGPVAVVPVPAPVPAPAIPDATVQAIATAVAAAMAAKANGGSGN